MRVRLGNLYTKVLSILPEEDRWLDDLLAFPDERARWGGTKDGKRHMYNALWRSFPTGYAPMVKAQALAQGVVYERVDGRAVPCAEDLNADLSWLRDYQLAAVQRAAKVGRGILWLPTGCLTGDAVLVVNRGGGARPMKLRSIVERLHGAKFKCNKINAWRSWDASIPTRTQSVDGEGYLRLNRIVEAYDNGEAEVFLLVTESGRQIRATTAHLFMTPEGWVQLGDLHSGDHVMVATWPTSFAKQVKRETFYRQTPHMQNHPHVQITHSEKDGKVYRVPYHRLVAEARENGVSVPELVGRIILGETEGLRFFDPRMWHVHHKDRDIANNQESNLEVLPETEHFSHHGKEQGWKHVAGRTVAERIASITPAGTQRVYDLKMETPLENYVANEFLVHNSGKSEIAIGLVRRLPCRWLFLVHRAGLMHQMAERYTLRTGLRAFEVGDGAPVPPVASVLGERLVVATFQTVAAAFKRKEDEAHTKEFLAAFDGIIIDEAHTLPSSTYWRVSMACKNAYYRFGMSGTPLARGDRRSTYTVAALGPVVCHVQPATLIDAGVLTEPTIRVLRVNHKLDEYLDWHEVYSDAIVEDARRNLLVATEAFKAAKPCLVFVQRIEHGEILRRSLERAGVKAEFVWGSKATAERQAAVKRLEAGTIEVIVCSVVFQEGIDIPSLRSVIIGTGGKSVIAALQRIGRGMRVDAASGKTTFDVVDFFDSGHKWLETHSRARIRAYQAESYKVTLVNP